MKRILTSLFAFALLLIMTQSNANAQLTGVKTIPGTYATLAAAIADLNTNGVGGGGVTFNIAPGYTETIPSGGYVINILSSPPTAGNTIVFQRNGAGVNPLFSSDVGGSGTIAGTGLGTNGDAFIKLVGTDYISFININLQENYTGGTTSLNMEYGFLMVRASSTDGCKNVTITGSTIQQQRSDIHSSCIASINRDAAGTITNPTTTDGRHENVSVQGCTLNNSFNGMYFQGFAASTPWDLYDHFYNIGTTTGNTLTNIGSLGVVNTNLLSGIFAQYLDSISINNNTIRVNNGTNGVTMYGVFLNTGVNSSANVNGNIISDTSGAASSQASAIGMAMGGTGTDNRVNIQNNIITNCTYIAPTTGTMYLIYLAANPYTLNVTGNTIRDISMGNGTSTASGAFYGIYCLSSNTTAGATYNVANNNVEKFTRSQSAAGVGNMIGIYFTSGGATTEMNNNTVDSLFNTSTTGITAGLYFSPTVTEVKVHHNTVSNIDKSAAGTSGAMYAYYQSTGTPLSRNYNNTAFNINNRGTTAVTYGYYDFATAGTGVEECYDNTFYNFTSNTSGVLIGAFVSNGLSTNMQTKRASGNIIHDLNHTGTGQTGGINMNYALYGNVYDNQIYNISSQNAASSPAVYGILLNNAVVASNYSCYNNMVSELYATASNTGLAILGVWINGGDTADVSYNTIYLDSTAGSTNWGVYTLYLAGPTSGTMKNNIIINKTVPLGTGANIGIFRATTVTYNAASNNNNVYVTPGAANYIYYDGAATHQTFGAFQTAVAPAETNSFTENSPFVNVANHPYNLDMQTSVPTLCESGGIPIPGITTDIHGTTRNASTPDVGADEFMGLKTPLVPGLISPPNNATNVIPNHPKVFVWSKALENYKPVKNSNPEETDAVISNYWLEFYADTNASPVALDSTLTDTTFTYAPNLPQLTPYWWRVKGKNQLGWGAFTGYFKFTTDLINLITQGSEIPTVFDLYQNYPNPFNPTTNIKFDIPKAGFVSLKVYDITGREVATLVNNVLEPSRYEVTWNGSQFSSGVYFFRIVAGDFVKVQKMILTK